MDGRAWSPGSSRVNPPGNVPFGAPTSSLEGGREERGRREEGGRREGGGRREEGGEREEGGRREGGGRREEGGEREEGGGRREERGRREGEERKEGGERRGGGRVRTISGLCCNLGSQEVVALPYIGSIYESLVWKYMYIAVI